MDNLEFNKAAAAVLTAGIVFMVSGVVASMLVKPHPLHHTVLAIDTGAAAGPATATKAEPLAPIAPLMASADAAAGEGIAKKQCASCHSFNEGGKNGVGPNLYGVLGRNHGGAAGFNYSEAVKGKAGPWSYEDMNAWLKNPKAYAAGTRMAYAGLNNEKQRADLIMYLRSLAASPVALP